MSEHTPGPWKTNDGSTIVRDTEDKRIADTAVARPYPECLANARLMAAAPKLLAALEALVYAYVELADSSTGREAQMQRIPAMVKAVQEAEQAIAEATA
jgi:hypothetical protein